MPEKSFLLEEKDDPADWDYNPTPEDRARLIVKRLEQFIRDGKTEEKGMSFSKWQDLAMGETVNTIRDAEKRWRNDQRFIDRMISIGAVAMVTTGVWGTVLALSFGTAHEVAGLILTGAGAVIALIVALWGIRKAERYYQFSRRSDLFQRVEKFEDQIRTLQKALDGRVADLEDALDQMEDVERLKRPL